MATLPTFQYHPDPIATGVILESDVICRACGEARGFIYVGPVYSVTDDLDEAICPWCIADGSAADKFDAEYTDADGVGGYGDWDAVSEDVLDIVCRRTPGFNGWQQERWWTHCDDAAAFLGHADAKRLTSNWAPASDVIQREAGVPADEWPAFMRALSITHSPTAYVFRCVRCGQFGGYADSD